MASKVQYKVRSACGDDLNFIYATWLDSYRYDSAIGKAHKNTIFFAEYKKVIDLLLEKSDVLIAHVPESEETILGYMVFEPQVLHYIYIKGSFWNLGLGRDFLFKNFSWNPIIYTHETFRAAQIIGKNSDFVHNNLLLFKKGES